jgi:carbon storage regulator
MLVLTRRIDQEIVIGNNIRVRVVAVQGDRVRLGVTAPRSVSVDRLEVHARRSEFMAGPSKGRSGGAIRPAGAAVLGRRWSEVAQ